MDLEARIRRLEDIEEIRNLATLYGIAMDERLEADTRAIFTADARLTSKDGVFAATGIEEIITTYEARWAALGPTSHVVHGSVIEIDPDNSDRATGIVTSHAEVVRNGKPMLASIIYNDEYRRVDGTWKFSSRQLGFFYYTEADRYAQTMLEPNRNRAYDVPQPADYPEALRGSN